MALLYVLRAGHSPEGPWLPSENHLFLFPSLSKQLFWPLSLCGSFCKTPLTVWVLLASFCFSQLNSEPFSCGFYLGQVDSEEAINISLHPPTLDRAQHLRARGRGLSYICKV